MRLLLTCVLVGLILGVEGHWWWRNRWGRQGRPGRPGRPWRPWQPRRPRTKPNIIFIFSDDLGYNDIGYNNNDVQTPCLDWLANSGRKLTNAYTSPLCTPSRHSLLTSTYPWKHGMDHLLIIDGAADCMPNNLRLMPEYFRDHGYKNHLLGKWHLGFCQEECLPTSRGFDTFYGFKAGEVDFYTKECTSRTLDGKVLIGYDWTNGTDTDRTGVNGYATDQITNGALDLIAKHDQEDPMFMFLSYNAPHIPLSVPKKFYDKYKNTKFSDDPEDDEARKVYLAMVSAMDDGINQIIRKLKDTGMYDNTLIVFSSDNGAQISDQHHADNTPYAGGKTSVYDGGNKIVSFISGGALPRWMRRSSTDELFHSMDWIPTLEHFITGRPFQAPNVGYDIDGEDQYNMIFSRGYSRRDEIVHKMDLDPFPYFGQIALRKGDYKLVWGFPGLVAGVGNDAYAISIPPSSRKRRSTEITAQKNEVIFAVGPNGEEIVKDTVELTQDNAKLPKMIGMTSVIYDSATKMIRDKPTTIAQLFNIKNDPSEQSPLDDDVKLNDMKDRVRELALKYYVAPPPNFSTILDVGKPENNGGEWRTGWCEKTNWKIQQEALLG